jgi:hypothetical protein
MALRNSAFLSFRGFKEELTKEFIDQFHRGLSGEIEAQLGREVGRVFLAPERLQAGDFFNEEIAHELCASATMVMIYTPSYFDAVNTYCAREYKGMLDLESQRLPALSAEQRTHGLIIPVIFRGEAHLPREIRDRRQYYNFQDFLLSHRTLNKHPKYAPILRDLGEYIAGRYRALSTLDPAMFNCDGYALPSADSIQAWLNTVVPIAPRLPGRAT